MSKNRSNSFENVNFVEKVMRWPLDTTGSHDFNQGDLLYRDPTSGNAYALDTDAHAAYLLGAAERQAFVALYSATQLSGGVALQKNYEPCALAAYGGIRTFYGTSGDTYKHGDQVFIGADAQTITNTAGGATHTLGIIILPDSSLQAATTLAYAAGALYPVWVIAQYPVTMF